MNNYDTSRSVLDYISTIGLCPDKVKITLLHILRIPSGGEELMGKRYIKGEPLKIKNCMENAKSDLVNAGFKNEFIYTSIIESSFSTVADGIIDYYNKHHHTMVVIGRKKMSKAEEFVLGDVSVKLVRSLENTAVVVVKTV